LECMKREKVKRKDMSCYPSKWINLW
jgi:hypothetical protein